MATSHEYIEFVCEQLSGVEGVRYRKMFGEYMVYVNDKPIFLVCDNTVFVKLLPEISELMNGMETGIPYAGAREHYVLDIENREKVRNVVEILEQITPLPKPKKRREGRLELSEYIIQITDKNAVNACAVTQKIAAESRESNRWYPHVDEIAGLLQSTKSLVRNRAITLIAANARWDKERRYDSLLDDILAHITDEKPITARVCVQALPEIAEARPELIPRIRSALESADVSRYRDSMRPLVEKDIAEVLLKLEA